MNSYVPYMGAKSAVAKELVGHLPPESTDTYIEPFVGGASVYFAKPKARISILNDIDFDLMSMHETVAMRPEDVMSEMQRLVLSRKLYEDTRTLRALPGWFDLPMVERAARMIYVLSCAFNANARSPFVASATVPLKFDPNLDLRPFAEHFRGATFERLHWAELLDRYVVQPRRISCAIFADPPYLAAMRADHYRHRFELVDQILLAHKLTRITQLNSDSRRVRIMVTLDDVPFVRALYRENDGWQLQPLAIRYNAGHHAQKTNELLITNFKVGESS